ncbi:MAG: lysoplasmalogenase family protein [Niameybacter sp.]|uniref:lysoplasmalogenase family protein n=1 Tax=Niameybacter sp. TaxID=2033640 RepID=UPI002FC92A09
MILLPIFIFIASLITLLIITYLIPQSKWRITIKSITSLGFLTIGIICYLSSSHSYSSAYLLLGLTLCFIGDIFLAFAHGRPLKHNPVAILGIITFGFAHLLFVISFILQGFVIPVFFLFLPISIGFLTLIIMIKDPFDFGLIRILIAIYAFIITLMLVAAFCTHIPIIIIGACFFVISDVILCFVYFFAKNYPILRCLPYIFYYIGQLLLALILFTL